MKTIAIIGQKGGTGKTHLAKLLLCGFAADGLTVLGVDLDPQASLCKWGDRRKQETPAIMPMLASRLVPTLDSARTHGVEIAVIDTAGRARDEALAAVQVADLVLIPLQPTTEDLETFPATQDYLRFAGTVAALAILVLVEPRGSQADQAETYLRDSGIAVCPVRIGRRAAYRHASTVGQVAAEYATRGSKAWQESRDLYQQVRRHLAAAGPPAPIPGRHEAGQHTHPIRGDSP